MSATIGIIGLGYWGPNLLRNFAATDGWRVLYGCDLSEAQLARWQPQYPAIRFTRDPQDLLKDPELSAVAIATPTATHFEMARAALEAGKHVLLEKPMAETVVQATALADLARQWNRHLLIDHTCAYTGAVRKIREIVQSGELGDLFYFESTRINLGLIQPDVNVLWDLAIHDLSILGEIEDLTTVTSIAAHGSRHYGRQEEIGHLHLTFASGLHAHIHVSWLSPVKLRQTIIGGTKRMLLFDDIQPSEKIRIYDTGVDHRSLGAMPQADPFFPTYRAGDVLIPKIDNTEALRREVAHFLAVIEGRETALVPAEQGVTVLRILESANQSLREKRTIPS
jgi:predicted dehydrogenase